MYCSTIQTLVLYKGMGLHKRNKTLDMLKKDIQEDIKID